METDCHNGDGFRNAYENSKLEAELLVRNAAGVDSLTVYRPSIVVGDSRTGYTNSYHNIYLFLQFTHILSQTTTRQVDGRWHHPVRLTFSGDEVLNLVPVDWVAGAISRIVQTPALHGRTYHLTHPEPTTCGVMEAALSRYFNYYGVEFVGPHGIPPGEATELEQMFYSALAAHDSYWNEHPDFDCGNTKAALPEWPCPRIDVSNLLRLFEFASRHHFGKKRGRARATSRERVAEH
jgi:nucleoside-diphosphate-sugar epimerase